MPSIEIKVVAEFRECEPDGQECSRCNQIAWLKVWQFWFGIGGGPYPSDYYLCDACYDNVYD